jgi:nicotinate-nucleotide adenylyltransferase
MKIGIYGGTFNPVHYGHLRTAQEVAETMCLDRVIFVPAGETPFDKPDLAEGPHRYKMVKSAIAGNSHFMISSLETRTRGKSFTVDTISSLSGKYKKSDLFFILGIDAFLDMPLWKKPDRLVNLTNIVVISRPGFTFAGLTKSPYLDKVPLKILRDLDKGKLGLFAFDVSAKRKGFLLNVTALNISASHIRELIRAGKNTDYLLPESVKSYIIANTLYVSR